MAAPGHSDFSAGGEASANPAAAEADAPQSVEVKFSSSNRGQAEVFRYLIESYPELREAANTERVVRAIRCAPEAIVFAALWVVFVWNLLPESIVFPTICGCLLAVPYLMYRSQHGPWHAFLRETDRLASTTSDLTGEVIARVESGGIVWSSTAASTTFHWNFVERLARTRTDFIVLFSDGAGGFSIPLSSFADPADADRWESRFLQCQEASGHGFAARVRTALAESDVRCGRCGYVLNGIQANNCPECGVLLTALRLRIFRYLQTPLVTLLFRGQQPAGPKRA